MNKYAAGGLINEALMRGKQVVVISHDYRASVQAFEVFAREVNRMDLGPTFGVRTIRARGDEGILCGVGVIRFKTVRQGIRGHSADVVFIDNEADRVALEGKPNKLQEFFNEVMAATQPDGLVVRS